MGLKTVTVTYSLDVPHALLEKLGVGEGGVLPPTLAERYLYIYKIIARKIEEKGIADVHIWFYSKQHAIKAASLAVLLNVPDFSALVRKLIDIAYDCLVEDKCEEFPQVREAQERLKRFLELRDTVIQLGRSYMKLRGSEVATRVISTVLRQAASEGLLKSMEDVARLAQILANALREVGMVESFSIE